MNSTYVVLAAILVIWLGVFFYLMTLDRKLNRIRREMKRHEG
jgi:CcmD family protein